MFVPKTQKIADIAKEKTRVIQELENMFSGTTRMYIDYANVRPWSTKLGWHVDIKRLKQFFDSFSTVQAVHFYSGYLEGDDRSEKEKKDIEQYGYLFRTKPVKIMRFSIDVGRSSPQSTALLSPFIKHSLLRKYSGETVEYLNGKFSEMNKQGELYIEDRKCNFDVEIGTDMSLDCERGRADVFVLWSGDSDFADTIQKLMSMGKKVVLFATAGKISRELGGLSSKGLLIFDIQKINDFICWYREIGIKSKRGSLAGGSKQQS